MRHKFSSLALFFALLLALLPASCLSQAYSYRGILKDIYLSSYLPYIQFGNARFSLYFPQGDSFAFSAHGTNTGQVFLSGNALEELVEVQINGKKVVGTEKPTFLRYSVTVAPDAKSATLHMTYGVGAKSREKHRYELTCSYTLYPEEVRLERSAQLYWVPDPLDPLPVEEFEGFQFTCQTPTSEQAILEVPGSYVFPFYQSLSAPVKSLENHTKTLPSAPDSDYGLIALTTPETDTCTLFWMDTHHGETHYTPSLFHKNNRLDLQFQDHRVYHLTPGSTVSSDTLRMEMSQGDLSDALLRYRQWVNREMPVASNTPAWVKQATLLQLNPAHFKGGFREIAQKLPLYRQSGFNTLSLMAYWEGGYKPLDPFKVNPAYGTSQDLKSLVAQAHMLKMRVLFDLDLSGVDEKSSLLNTYPAMFTREQNGNYTKNPLSGTIAINWASREYASYLTTLVVHQIETYSMDGYRAVGANYKEAQHYLDMSTLAYQSGTYSPHLLEGVLKVAQTKKPDFALLIEAPGTIFHTVSNFVQDGSVERMAHLAERLERGKAQAEEVKANLSMAQEMLPKGANRVFELRSGAYHSKNLEALLLLCGIPMVQSGSASLTSTEAEEYRRLLGLRERFPEIAQGELLLKEIESSAPNVFTAIRHGKERDLVIILSLASKPIRTVLTSHLTNRFFSPSLLDPAQTKPLFGTFGEAGELVLTIQPNQILIGELTKAPPRKSPP